jgi:hypothetical protein
MVRDFTRNEAKKHSKGLHILIGARFYFLTMLNIRIDIRHPITKYGEAFMNVYPERLRHTLYRNISAFFGELQKHKINSAIQIYTDVPEYLSSIVSAALTLHRKLGKSKFRQYTLEIQFSEMISVVD